jgi:hypothetical protein
LVTTKETGRSDADLRVRGEDEIGSFAPRFVDAVVAWGDETAIRQRLDAHIDAGADHVCIQAIAPAGTPGPDIKAIEALAPR